MEIALDKKSPIQGIVSKHLDRAYGAGRCKHWVKVRTPRIPLTAGSETYISLEESRHTDKFQPP
jgi:hypothetical protein